MGLLSLVTLFVVLQGFLGVDALGTCAGKLHKATDCARTPYNVKVASSAGACCELCASEDACVQWTFHALSRKCSRTNSSESLEAGISTLLSTCGIRTSPGPLPSPSPPPSPGTDSIWAVIAAGSKGFSNYRHQADACHAYQILKKTGIPEDHIILMMQDDVAHSSSNPFPGKLFNKPGDDSQDVYDGCKVDYSGDQVTAQLFLSVITGDESAVPAGGKVLKSGKSDRVFLNFVDHGGVGLIAFPNGPVLHSADLSAALKTMQQKEMFSELVFYMEACESGSMFPDLTPDGKIFAVTAANAEESSWGYYCMPQNDTVQGKHLGTCLGDLFSIAWMEDSDLGQLATESIREQVARVTARTTKSHVMTFGDESFENEHIGKFVLIEHVDVEAEAKQRRLDEKEQRLKAKEDRKKANRKQRRRGSALSRMSRGSSDGGEEDPDGEESSSSDSDGGKAAHSREAEKKALAFRRLQVQRKIEDFLWLYRNGQNLQKINSKGRRYNRRVYIDTAKRALVVQGAGGPSFFPFVNMKEVDMDTQTTKEGRVETHVICAMEKSGRIYKELTLAFPDQAKANNFVNCITLFSMALRSTSGK